MLSWFIKAFYALRGTLGIALYGKDANGNITGFVAANGNPVIPINKTLTQFLALTPSDVADGAVIHITDLHTTSGAGGVYATWDASASKWGQNFGAAWVFDTYDLLIAKFPLVSKWDGFKFWVKTGVGVGGAELINTGTRYRHTQKGRVLVAVNNTRDTIAYSGNGSITGTALTLTGTTSGTLTVGSIIAGTGVTAGTRITDLGTWNGTTGVLTITPSHAATGAIAISADKSKEKIELQWAAPAGFIALYDKITVDHHAAKSGTTASNFLARDVHIGTAGTVSDTSVLTTPVDLRITASNLTLGIDEIKHWVVTGSTTVQRGGPASSSDYNGFSATTRDASQTIPNISNALYVSVGYWVSNAAPTDTATFENGSIYLEMAV